MEFIYLPIFIINYLKMSLEEFEDNTDPKTKRYLLMKSVMDFGMGFIYIGVAFIILFSKKIGLNNDFADSTTGKVFAGLILLYGLWRFYRGIKKDYIREK